MDRRRFLKRAGIGSLAVAAVPALQQALGTPAAAFADGNGTKVRWDIVVADAPGFVAGGTAAAFANDGSQIVMTGSGTFGPEGSANVTGGGTWTTSDASGTPTESGTYTATGVVQSSAVLTTAVANVPSPDTIGNPADARGGLAVLRIAYSDGSEGVLTISCRLGAADLPAVFEGITATKDVVAYWNQTTHGFTIFHVLPPGK
jgi:hypothetical protein